MSSNVLIYTNNMLAASETFIRNPPQAFRRYTPYYIGSLQENGLPLPDGRVIVANGSGMLGRLQQTIRLRLTGDFGVARLSGRLKRLDPLLLQAHYGHAAVYAMPLVDKLNIPFLIYYHGMDATLHDADAARSRYTRRYLAQRDLLKQRATLILAQSDFLKEELLKQGFPAEKLRTHYIGIDSSGDAPLPLDQRDPCVLFVARLTKKKGARHLINAMQGVQQRYPDMRLVVVGDGPARERLENQAREMLSNYVFIGWQTPPQVDEWMRRARVFCVPSITAPSGDAEGFGMVFIEAQRWGTPVVSFAHGGIVESVADGETGLLAPEGDETELTAHLLRLIEDDELWRRFSQSGYERVKNHFDLYQLAGQLEDIYDEILAGKLH